MYDADGRMKTLLAGPVTMTIRYSYSEFYGSNHNKTLPSPHN